MPCPRPGPSLIAGTFGDRFPVIFVQFIAQEIRVGPHGTREGVVLSITERRFPAAFAMWGQPETDGIATHFEPQMAARIARPPAQQHHRIVFFKRSPATQLIFVDCLQKRRETTLAQYSFRVFANGNALCFLLLSQHSVFSFVDIFVRTRGLHSLSNLHNQYI